jgi:hypothetical protein
LWAVAAAVGVQYIGGESCFTAAPIIAAAAGARILQNL